MLGWPVVGEVLVLGWSVVGVVWLSWLITFRSHWHCLLLLIRTLLELRLLLHLLSFGCMSTVTAIGVGMASSLALRLATAAALFLAMSARAAHQLY